MCIVQTGCGFGKTGKGKKGGGLGFLVNKSLKPRRPKASRNSNICSASLYMMRRRSQEIVADLKGDAATTTLDWIPKSIPVSLPKKSWGALCGHRTLERVYRE